MENRPARRIPSHRRYFDHWKEKWATFWSSRGLWPHLDQISFKKVVNGDLSSTTPDGKTTVNAYTFGQSKYNPRDRTHSELLVKGSQRVIAVELK